jgi:transcriptional regulator with XRE-family HTH domain
MSTKRKANSLGEFLRVHRLSEDMSQVEFAKFMGGGSKQRLCDIEHGRFAVSPFTLYGLIMKAF